MRVPRVRSRRVAFEATTAAAGRSLPGNAHGVKESRILFVALCALVFVGEAKHGSASARALPSGSLSAGEPALVPVRASAIEKGVRSSRFTASRVGFSESPGGRDSANRV